MDEIAESFRIDRLTAEFFYYETEQNFRYSARSGRVRDIRQSIYLAALFYLAFALTDFFAMQGSKDYQAVLFTRLAICAVGLTAASLAPRHWPMLVNGVIPSLVSGTAMAAFIAITFLRPFSVGWHGMSMMAMLLGVYVFIPNRYIAVVLIGLTSSLLFMVLAAVHFDLQTDELARLLTLLAVTNVLGGMTNYRLSRLMREEYREHSILKRANQRLHVEMEERARLEEALRRRAELDDATGVPNRSTFFANVDIILLRAEQAREPLSVLIIDVDYFKQINVTYGYMSSDEVLKALVAACNAFLGERHYLARLGGEEFVVLLPGMDLVAGAKMAEQIRAECQRTPVAMGEVNVHFTVSIGVVQYQADEPAKTALRRADAAMAAAKFKGRNRVEAVD